MKRPTGKISVRPMVIKDIPQVEVIDRLSFTNPWSRQTFIHELRDNLSARYFVFMLGRRMIGYAGCWQILDEAHVTNIAVHPHYRGYGWGKAVLDYMMRFSRLSGMTKMTLEVRVSNTVARTMYEKRGFTAAGIRKAYYSDNKEDALIMWVTLDEYRSKENVDFGN